MILRRLARPLLASIFISGGINALRSLEGHAEAAGPFLDKMIGQQADALPDAIPTDPMTLVKVDAAVKIGAGAALALGKFPRLSSLLLLGSLVPTTLSGHAFWEKDDPSEREQQQIQFIKNASIAGGLLLSATAGGRCSGGRRASRAKAGEEVG